MQSLVRERKLDRPSPVSTTSRVWVRLAIILIAFSAWVIITRAFPLYFQRDELKMMYWVHHHGILDGFIPTPECGFFHDAAYRPLVYAYWYIAYSAFGMNFPAHYLVTGLLFIAALACVFKLAKKLSNDASGWLAVFIWLAAFQFLMTTLFWLTQQMYFVMMIMALGGFHLFVTGLGSSRLKTTAGIVVMLSSVLTWEPQALVLGTAVAIHLLIRARSLKWSRVKTLGYALLSLAVGPAYYTCLPFTRQRMEISGASLTPTLPEIIGRLSFYSGYLTSGMTGLIILIPAVYFILSRLMSRRTDAAWCTPASLILAVVVSAATSKFGLYPIGLLAIAAAGLLLPRPTYVLLPFVFVPLAGLMIFAEPSRTYLLMPSYALCILAALETRELGLDVAAWWNRVVRSRVLGIVVLVAFALAGVAMVAHKAKAEVSLLRLRSDVTQGMKSMTPHLRRLPIGATVISVDYESMDVTYVKDSMRWTDREKLLYQAPVASARAPYWFYDIGRGDLKSVKYADYRLNRASYGANSNVYIWLETVKDHEFFAKQHLNAAVVASIRRGEAKSTLLRIE